MAYKLLQQEDNSNDSALRLYLDRDGKPVSRTKQRQK